ncbi:MAG: FumA C-terminus/TtdB family hydratase beta subunit [Sphaerochaeta sp.]
MKKLNLPITQEDLASLKAYDEVCFSGTLYVGRDQVHQRLAHLLEEGKALPVDLSGQAIYYMGPSPALPGMVIGSCGPTTSARMDLFTPQLLEQGLKILIGKGPRSKAVYDSLVNEKAVYVQAFGGCGALYAKTIISVETVAFDDLGPEALLRLEVKDFPAIVAIDSHGGTVF